MPALPRISCCADKGFLYFDIERKNILYLFYIATGSLHRIWDSLFGPLGLFYSSIIGGFVMMAVSFVVGFITLGFGLIVTWPTCILWAYLSTKRYNAKLASASMVM